MGSRKQLVVEGVKNSVKDALLAVTVWVRM